MTIPKSHLHQAFSSSYETATSIVELRRYRLHPGTRETLIDLFDHKFIEAQEACGMRVIGQFRDLDDSDSFVWLRGFHDMPSRAEALNSFYTGPTWAQHATSANATMINSDNVLLLRPATPETGFIPADKPRPSPDATISPPGLVVLTTCYLAPRTERAFAEFFMRQVQPELEQASARTIAILISEHSPNTFPRLPVREGETVFVWLSSFSSEAAYDRHLETLARSISWANNILPEMERHTWRMNEVLRLTPTARSLLPS